MGELIYALEYRDEWVETPYYVDGGWGKKLKVPKNLYVIGTMNTADRSIGHIDYAVRRRFAFIPCPPNPAMLTGKGLELFEAVAKLFQGGTLSNDFHADDVQPGHTYFMAEGGELARKFAYQVYPLLREYYKDGVLVGSKDKLCIQLDNEPLSLVDPIAHGEVLSRVKRFVGKLGVEANAGAAEESEGN